jgi:hypothetical protein
MYALDKVKTSLAIPADVVVKIAKRAEERGVTVAQYINAMLVAHTHDDEWTMEDERKRQQIIKGEGGASGYMDLTGKYRDIGWWDSPSRGEAFRSNKGGLPCTWYQGGAATQGSTSLDCRIMDTTLCALQLMVYYRFLPTSQQVDASVRDAGVDIGAPVARKKNDEVTVTIARRKAK